MRQSRAFRTLKITLLLNMKKGKALDRILFRPTSSSSGLHKFSHHAEHSTARDGINNLKVQFHIERNGVESDGTGDIILHCLGHLSASLDSLPLHGLPTSITRRRMICTHSVFVYPSSFWSINLFQHIPPVITGVELRFSNIPFFRSLSRYVKRKIGS